MGLHASARTTAQCSIRTRPTEQRRRHGCLMLLLLTSVTLVVSPCMHLHFPHPRCSAEHLRVHSIYRPRRSVDDADAMRKGGECTPSAAACHLPLNTSPWGSSPSSPLSPSLRLPSPPPISPPKAPAPAPACTPSHAQDFPFPPLPARQRLPHACLPLRGPPFLPANRPPLRLRTRWMTHRQLTCP